MNYTFFAVAMYIILRGLQVLCGDHLDNRRVKIFIRVVAVLMLYAAIASLIVWYTEIPFLGFAPGK